MEFFDSEFKAVGPLHILMSRYLNGYNVCNLKISRKRFTTFSDCRVVHMVRKYL